MTPNRDDHDVDILALVKTTGAGCERYVYAYGDTRQDRAELLRVIGRQASNPDLSLTWYDAATLSARLRRRHQPQEPRRQ